MTRPFGKYLALIAQFYLLISSSACKPNSNWWPFGGVAKLRGLSGTAGAGESDDEDSVARKAVVPTPGQVAGPVLIQLSNIQGLKPYYNVRPFADYEDVRTYDRPFVVYPPVSLYVMWGDGKEMKRIHRFDYRLAAGSVAQDLPALSRYHNEGEVSPPFPYPTSASKILKSNLAEGLPRISSPLDVEQSFEALSDNAAIRNDGINDTIGDVPFMDIKRAGAWGSTQRLNVTMEMRGDLDRDQAVYGWRLLSVEKLNFKPGEQPPRPEIGFLREISYENGLLVVRMIDRSTGERRERLARGDSIVMVYAKDTKVIGVSISWQELQLDPRKELLAVQPYTRRVDAPAKPTSNFDDAYPILIDDVRLSRERQSFASPGGGTIAVEYVTSAQDPGLSSEHRKYLPMALRGLSVWLGESVLDGREVPVLNFHAGDQTYGGYNMKDLGITTRLGPFSPPVAVAQLMAHEAFHQINTWRSAKQDLWIQEGLAEWYAERFLYQTFDTSTAYRYLRNLRFDRLFDDQSTATTPLDEWKDPAKASMYSKALAFFDQLENIVGADVIRDVIHVARQLPMDSIAFQKEIVGRTRHGSQRERVLRLFERWVTAGPLDDSDRLRFEDNDNDGLLGIDEDLVGLDLNRYDSDGDGFSDWEAFTSLRPQDTAPRGLVFKEPGSFLRVASGQNALLTFSPFFWSKRPEDFLAITRPIYVRGGFRLPWRLTGAASPDIEGIVEEPFYRWNGERFVVVTPLLPKEGTLRVPFAPYVNSQSEVGQKLSKARSDAKVIELEDASFDVPKEAGSFDITRVSFVEEGDAVRVHLQTRDPIDANGFQGEYHIAFSTIRWQGMNPTVRKDYEFVVANGYPTLIDVAGDDTARQTLPAGTEFLRVNGLDLKIPSKALANWFFTDGDKMICPTTIHRMTPEVEWRDDTKCLTVRSLGMDRLQSVVKSPIGGISQKIELDVASKRFADEDIGRLLTGLERGVVNAERMIGKPGLERSRWPFRLNVSDDGRVFVRAFSQLGAVMSLSPEADFAFVLPLATEQLMRLRVTDALDRRISPPLWIQDLFVYWLNGAIAPDVVGSRDAVRYHHWRLDSYLCYLRDDLQCRGFFPGGDRPLKDMSRDLAGGYAGEKSLMFALLLDTTVGTEAMARVMQTYGLGVLDEVSLLEGLIAVRPDLENRLKDLWKVFVIGSGDPAEDRRLQLEMFGADSENSLLFKFEGDYLRAHGGSALDY